MTYQELIDKINDAAMNSGGSLEDDVVVFAVELGEFLPVSTVDVTVGDDVLHDGHIYLETTIYSN